MLRHIGNFNHGFEIMEWYNKRIMLTCIKTFHKYNLKEVMSSNLILRCGQKHWPYNYINICSIFLGNFHSIINIGQAN